MMAWREKDTEGYQHRIQQQVFRLLHWNGEPTELWVGDGRNGGRGVLTRSEANTTVNENQSLSC